MRDWLHGRIGAGMRLGLSTCSEMLDRLGNPHRDYPTIHVAGTNGKGSLCAHLSSLGASNGDLVGLFTSPHLITEEERTRIDGRPIDPDELDTLLEEVRLACESEPAIEPTYFEVTFLVSMLAFSRAGVDRAVIETGMGGRLDSTSLVEPDVCAITTISMDHSEILGDSLAQIASEKAGIHKPGTPLVCLHSEDKSVRDSIEAVAGPDVIWFHTDASDAQDVAREMSLEVGRMIGWDAKEAPVNWSGRTNQPLMWSGVECYLSAAHNSESLTHDLARISGREHVMVLGMTQKGDLSESASPLSDDSGRVHCIVTEVNGGRNPSVEPRDLASAISSMCDTQPEVVPDTTRAMEIATELARGMGCAVYVTGSVYLVGKVIEESLSRTGGDAWNYLTIHPPRATTEG
jgi:folylpolyglutamate synthase/dihydropteroate synthase